MQACLKAAARGAARGAARRAARGAAKRHEEVKIPSILPQHTSRGSILGRNAPRPAPTYFLSLYIHELYWRDLFVDVESTVMRALFYLLLQCLALLKLWQAP